MGLPMTAYLSVMLFAFQFVGLGEVQVRVMLRISVSRRMSGGSGRRGRQLDDALCCRIQQRCPDERLTSTLSTLPSARMETVSCRLP